MGDRYIEVVNAKDPDDLKRNAGQYQRADLGIYPKGTRLKVEGKVPGYLPGGIFDLAGAEYFSGFLAPHGCHVKDVRHEGGTLGFGGKVVCYCEADFVVTTGFLLAVGAAFLGLAFAIGSVSILIHGDDYAKASKSILDPSGWIPIGLIAVGGIFLLKGGGSSHEKRSNGAK